MFETTTERLWLLGLSRAVIEARLSGDELTLAVDTPAGSRVIHAGPDWPGDSLPLFPSFLRHLDDPAGPEHWVAVRRTDGEAVGQGGTKTAVRRDGAVEIGYGFVPEARGRGLATEAIGAFTAYLLARPDVRSVTAETLVTNLASQRVLEKSGFGRTGSRQDAEDGPLYLWSRTA